MADDSQALKRRRREERRQKREGERLIRAVQEGTNVDLDESTASLPPFSSISACTPTDLGKPMVSSDSWKKMQDNSTEARSSARRLLYPPRDTQNFSNALATTHDDWNHHPREETLRKSHESPRDDGHMRTHLNGSTVKQSSHVAFPGTRLSLSPMSSASFSQSPAKRSVSFQPLPATEEEEDLVQIALQLKAQKDKRKEEAMRNTALSTFDSHHEKTSVSKTTSGDDFDEMDSNLIQIALQLKAQKAKQRKEAIKSATIPDVELPKETTTFASGPTMAPTVDKSSTLYSTLEQPKLSMQVENEEDEFLRNYKEIEMRKREVAERQRSAEEQQKKPRNPIALLHREDDDDGLASPASIKEKSLDKIPRSKSMDDDLWIEDKDVESAIVVPEKKSRKRTSKGAKVTPTKARLDLQVELVQNAHNSDGSDEDENDNPEDDLRPNFSNPALGPPSALEPLQLPFGENETDCDSVPASINRYLQGYQREGTIFLHSCVTKQRGAILGDDMGLGKTIQIMSLLAALLKKTGTRMDKIELKRRERLIAQKVRETHFANEQALLHGKSISSVSFDSVPGVENLEWAPILIIVPPSVVQNWLTEFSTWGHFGVSSYQGTSRSVALDRVRYGIDEVLVCGRKLLSNDFDLLNTVPWKLVIVDEFHECKNRKSQAYVSVQSIRSTHKCPIIGMTGTLMQNNHEEMWNLVDLVEPGFLGDWKSFQKFISTPIMLGRSKSATVDAIARSKARLVELTERLKSIYIHRKKADVLGDELPMKDERVLFCELEPIQKRLYEHILSLPDFVLLRYAHAPCDCGVNQKFFVEYNRMKTTREKIDYRRRNLSVLVARKDCCHKLPLNPDRDLAGQPLIHPDAALWRAQHTDGKQCLQCPFCILFPALTKLFKLSSHAGLLQAERDPISLKEGSSEWNTVCKDVAFAKVAFPNDVLSKIPGGSYVREDSIMNDHASLSGKMRMLDRLLRDFNTRNDRVLIFSYSTQMLDLIQHFVRARAYTFRRLDGSTPTKRRQELIDEFQRDKTIFLFLISTRAGGLGLNLTAANVVICYDVNFNPSYDEQAQDRAYRIGQTRDVTVIRLVAQGTIEELKYVRQVYKVQLKQETLGNADHADAPTTARLFRGVAGDKSRKGELFGSENLLRYKDGSFMGDMWKSADDRSARTSSEIKLRKTSDLTTILDNLSVKDVEDIGGSYMDDFEKAANGGLSNHKEGDQQGFLESFIGEKSINHEDFLRSDRGDAAIKLGEDGFDEEMGGASQMVHNVLENADISDDEELEEPTPTTSPTEMASVGVPVKNHASSSSSKRSENVIADSAARVSRKDSAARERLESIPEMPEKKKRPAPSVTHPGSLNMRIAGVPMSHFQAQKKTFSKLDLHQLSYRKKKKKNSG